MAHFCDHKILHMAGIDAVGHFGEACFQSSLPSNEKDRHSRQALVPVASFDEQIEIIRAHGSGSGMDFVSEINAEGIGMLPQLGGFFDEPVLAFFHEIVIAAFPEAHGYPVANSQPKAAPQNIGTILCRARADIEQRE